MAGGGEQGEGKPQALTFFPKTDMGMCVIQQLILGLLVGMSKCKFSSLVSWLYQLQSFPQDAFKLWGEGQELQEKFENLCIMVKKL